MAYPTKWVFVAGSAMMLLLVLGIDAVALWGTELHDFSFFAYNGRVSEELE